jgi:tRNA(Ser,Leu) C12 N-acetylase TAN1
MRSDDWNVVATVYDGEFREAARLLSPFGRVVPTEYRNVLVMHVENAAGFLEALRSTLRDDASIANSVARIVPVTERFRFESPAQFEAEAFRILDEWLPELAGKKFHVRMHRRGFKGRLSSQREEQLLGHHLLEGLRAAGSTGRITFDNPDVVVVVETLGQEAGVARWARSQLREHELLRLD